MVLTQVMQAFAEKMGIIPPEPDDRQEYALTFDDSLTVRFIPFTKETVIFQGVIGKIPEDQRQAEDHLKKILTQNLSRMKIQKEVLSIEKDTNEVIIFRQIPIEDLSMDEFEEALEEFVNQMERWIQTLSAPPESPPELFSFIIP